MNWWPPLPYELIGMAVVALIALIVVLALLIGSILVVLFIWCRGLTWLSNRMYKGYGTEAGERPPLWKLRISGVSLALSRFQFRTVPAAYREAKELADENITFHNYLKQVFIDQ